MEPKEEPPEFLKKPDFVSTPLGTPMTEFAFSLKAQRNDEHIVSGTAIVIAPYLAITAGHVLDGFFRHFYGKSIGDSSAPQLPSEQFSLQAMQMRPDLGLASIWNVTKFWFCKFTDISVLRLTPRTTEHLEYNWRTPTLCLAPPSLGDRIASFGYMKSHANAENQKITWYVEGVTSVGTVKEVYPLGRDKVMLPFPCFRTNMRIEGGMSGGPAFDDNGQLIGINCSGFSAQDAGGEHTGHISCLWPLMGLKVDMETSIHSQGTFYPLLDLASRGIIHTSNLDCISLAHDGMLYYHEKK